jgi:hypothetical protein
MTMNDRFARQKPPFGIATSNFRFTIKSRLNSEIRQVRKSANSGRIAEQWLRWTGQAERPVDLAPTDPGPVFSGRAQSS